MGGDTTPTSPTPCGDPSSRKPTPDHLQDMSCPPVSVCVHPYGNLWSGSSALGGSGTEGQCFGGKWNRTTVFSGSNHYPYVFR